MPLCVWQKQRPIESIPWTYHRSLHHGLSCSIQSQKKMHFGLLGLLLSQPSASTEDRYHHHIKSVSQIMYLLATGIQHLLPKQTTAHTDNNTTKSSTFLLNVPFYSHVWYCILTEQVAAHEWTALRKTLHTQHKRTRIRPLSIDNSRVMPVPTTSLDPTM